MIRTIRDQIQHEDNLIVQRLSWLMVTCERSSSSVLAIELPADESG